jgi:hypothetical protein
MEPIVLKLLGTAMRLTIPARPTGQETVYNATVAVQSDKVFTESANASPLQNAAGLSLSEGISIIDLPSWLLIDET